MSSPMTITLNFFHHPNFKQELGLNFNIAKSCTDFHRFPGADVGSQPMGARRTFWPAGGNTLQLTELVVAVSGQQKAHLKTHSGEKSNKCNQCASLPLHPCTIFGDEVPQSARLSAAEGVQKL